jgi:hypothetical protein
MFKYLIVLLLFTSPVAACPKETDADIQRAKFEACMTSPGCNLSQYSGIDKPSEKHSDRSKHLIPSAQTLTQ